MNLPHEFKVMRVRECAPEPAMIDTPERAVEYWHANIPKADWFDPDKEAFVVLVLNTRKRILGHNLVTLGTLDTCTVHSREVFRPIIMISGASAILAHNHPSGDPTPSDADIKVTRDLIRAGQLLKIEIVDHVVILSQDWDKIIYAECRIMPSCDSRSMRFRAKTARPHDWNLG